MNCLQNILDEKVSYQGAAWSPITDELSINEALKRIKDCQYDPVIRILRNFLSNNENQKYDDNKKRLPAVSFCGTFDAVRNKDNLKKYNNLIVIDIDKLSCDEIQRLKTCFVADDYIYSFWESPSGNGLKGIVALNYEFDISRFDINESHKAAFIKLTKYFDEKYSIALDSSGSDITRLCFFSSDSNLHTKSNIKYFHISENDLSKPKVKKTIRKKNGKKASQGVIVSPDCLMNPANKNRPSSRYRIQSIIKYLSKRNKSITSGYENWFRVALAVANTFTHNIGEKYYLRLCKLDGVKYDEQGSKNILRYCYANTKGEITFSTLFHFAKLQGYKSKGEGCSEDGKSHDVIDDVVSISCSEVLAVH